MVREQALLSQNPQFLWPATSILVELARDLYVVMAELATAPDGSRLALELSGAILLVGVAGYGWQGSPDMPGHPVASVAHPGRE